MLVKAFLGNPKKEMVWPTMFICTWLSFSLQSATYLLYHYDVAGVRNIVISQNILKISILLLFFSSVFVLSVMVLNKSRYEKAERWFDSIPDANKRDFVKLTGFAMISSFILLVSWAIFIM